MLKHNLLTCDLAAGLLGQSLAEPLLIDDRADVFPSGDQFAAVAGFEIEHHLTVIGDRD